MLLLLRNIFLEEIASRTKALVAWWEDKQNFVKVNGDVAKF